MRIFEIHVHHHFDRIEEVIGLLKLLLRKEDTIMLNIEELKSQVEETVGVEASAVTLLQGIAAEIAALNDPAAADLAKKLKDATDPLAAAVAANTVAAQGG